MRIELNRYELFSSEKLRGRKYIMLRHKTKMYIAVINHKINFDRIALNFFKVYQNNAVTFTAAELHCN